MGYGSVNGNWQHGWGGGSWVWMTIMMVVFWGGLIWFALTLRGRNRVPQHSTIGPPPSPAPHGILARGEIEPDDDYHRRLDSLQGDRSSGAQQR